MIDAAMKTTLFAALLAVGAVPAFAQGTVWLNNQIRGVVVAPVYGPIPGHETLSLSGNGPASGDPRYDPFPTGVTDYMGAPRLEGANYTAELWYAPGIGVPVPELIPLPDSQRAFESGAEAGYLSPPVTGFAVVLPGLPPGAAEATFQLRAWENLSGTFDPVDTYSEAVMRGVAHGCSAPFEQLYLGGGGFLPLPPASMENLRSFNIAVPEPSASCAVTAIILLAYAFKRRRR